MSLGLTYTKKHKKKFYGCYMHINYYQNGMNFTARNVEIRYADKIVRKVNNDFPRLSSTFIENFKGSESHQNFLNSLSRQIRKMRDNSENDYNSARKGAQKVKAVINPIQTLKIGNCREAAYLSLIAAKINGLKNVKFANLFSPNGYDLDHVVVKAGCGKKSYVLDAWLGFADYVPNAIKRWQNEFAQYFNFANAQTKKIVLKHSLTDIKSFLENADTKILKKECPNLSL